MRTQRNADGRIVRKAGGRWVRAPSGTACCCAAPAPEPCTSCQTTSATVTISGNIACWSGCMGEHAWSNGGNISGTYTLAYKASAVGAVFSCFYEFATNNGPVELRLYKGDDCSGDGCDDQPIQGVRTLTIQLYRLVSDGKWYLDASVNGVHSDFASGGFSPPGCTGGFDNSCDQWCWTKSLSNTVTCNLAGTADSNCGLGLIGPATSGGSATVTVPSGGGEESGAFPAGFF